ncbi:MAG TPA: Xaa-Pro peptidase family protein [Chlamydiales bacterium]|nr:Xaa-Pro peptidase family protein [Chlamydiales bacterium]
MRLGRACNYMADFKVDALMIENPSDIFYLTNQWFSLATILLTPDTASLIVDGRYFEHAKKTVPCNVILAEKNVLGKELEKAKRVGFDSAFMTVDRSFAMQHSIPSKEWIPIPRPLKELRVCKDEGEIAALKEAARITSDGFRSILAKLKEGISEQELGLEFEIYCRRQGASKCSFDPIVAFGLNSAFPHYRTGKAHLQKNQIALFDLGSIVQNYAADMTRVFFFGQPASVLDRLYRLVKEAHDRAASAIRPGTRLGQLDEIVRSFFAKEGVEQLFSHGLGHGVGIDVHEHPVIRFDSEDRDLLLRPNMVFTIEPGLYLPGEGGVRYENTFVVTETGSENFYATVS